MSLLGLALFPAAPGNGEILAQTLMTTTPAGSGTTVPTSTILRSTPYPYPTYGPTPIYFATWTPVPPPTPVQPRPSPTSLTPTDLSLKMRAVTKLGDGVARGDVIIYVLDIYNLGNATAPMTVIATEVPEGTVWVSTNDPASITSYRGCWINQPRDVLCGVEATPPGSPSQPVWSFSFTVRVEAPPGTSITNSATLDYINSVSDSNRNNNVASVTTTVIDPTAPRATLTPIPALLPPPVL